MGLAEIETLHGLIEYEAARRALRAGFPRLPDIRATAFSDELDHASEWRS